MARPDPARRRRPWRRTRAYRLTRTVVLTVTLAVGGVWWSRADEPAPAPVTATDATPVAPSAGNGERAGAGAAAGDRRPDPAATTPAGGSAKEPSGAAGPPSITGPGRTDGPTRGRSGPATSTPPTGPTRASGPAQGRPGQPTPTPSSGPARAAGPAKGRPGQPTPTPPTGPSRTTGPANSRPGPARPLSPAAHPPPPPPARPKTPPPPRPPAPLPRSRPTTFTLPYLGIEAPVVDLRLDRHRQLTAPPDDKSNLVGWYADGPSPGENGTVIVVGHRDTRAGPAVFIGLDAVTPGRRVELRRVDGRTAVYTVDAVKTYDKANFPSREVYGARARPELRLITCGGGYDRRTGYTGNIVVYAHLTATR
ncbi:class F sortase [Streptomyces sp. NPDC047042]|uniref:class F sortase n=1 Tax=Streptomyces sp. NPDC047042 TaxID=3154807 RepID=UPI0033D39BCE